MSVCWTTEREKEGVLDPEDTCPKTVQSVLDVLLLKHPEARPPKVQILEACRGKPPAMVPVEITDVTVDTVAQQLLGWQGQ